MKAEVETYIKQRDLRTALIAEKESIKDVANRQEADAEQQRDKKINTIRDRCFEETGRIREKAKALTEPIDQGIRELDPKIQDIDRKIEFLKHREKSNGKMPNLDDEAIKPYHDRELVNLGALYEDEFTIIKLFIVGNDRPKNKYTLSMVGNTLLDGLIKVPYDYGCNVDYGNIRRSILSRPTVEELERYAQNLRHHEISYYADVKEQYLQTVADYTLEDFKAVLEPQHVNEFYAPLLFTIHGLGDTLDYRLYDGFYYRSGSDLQGDPFDYIKVNDILYKRYCRPEQLRITQTGNTMFGDWWSLYITKDSHGELFTRENWDKTLVDTNDYVRERNIDRRTPINFTPPRVEWKGSLPVFEDIKL